MEQSKQNIKQMKLVTKLKRQRNKETINRSQNLYDFVIERNFEIIDDLLRKLDKVFIRHEQLQVEIASCNKRLLKVETDIQAIHNEHRRDAFQIFGKITNMQSELSGIDNHIQIFYDNYKRNQVRPFNSCQVFKNTEENSQNCLQNIDPIPNNKDQEVIITTKSAKSYYENMKDDEKYFRYENEDSEKKSKSKKQKLSNQKMRGKKDSSMKRRLSQNYKYTEVTPFQKIKMFPEKEANSNRKLSRSKKKEYGHRQSLNYNIESGNSGRYYYQDSVITKERRRSKNQKYPSNFMKDFSNSNNSYRSRQNSVIKKQLFQIRESQNEKKSISYSQNQKMKQEDNKQSSVKEKNTNQLDKSAKFILACIQHAFVSNVKQNKDTLSDYQIATLVHRFEEGTKYIVQRLDENAKKIQELSRNLNEESLEKRFCSHEFFMKTVKQIYNEIKQVRQSIFQQFVTKEDLKQMLLYSSDKGDKGKIEKLLSCEDQKRNTRPETQSQLCSIVSKCLSCNRLGKLKPLSQNEQQIKNKEKKRVFTITELKKKTAKIIRS